MVEQAREAVDGDAGGTYEPLSEEELDAVERLTALFLGPDQNRSAAAERALSALGLDYLPRLVALTRELQRSEAVVVREALARAGTLKSDLARAVEEMLNVYHAPTLRRREFLAEALRSFGVDPEGHAAPAVRTPEEVLRAMLKAYEAAALDLAVSLARETGSTSHRSLWEAEDQVDRVRVTLAHCIANGGQFPGADEPIEQDYLDRLSGVRPLDAPPPGNRFPGGGPESTRGAGP